MVPALLRFVPFVSTPLALVAFIVVVLAWLEYRKLKHDEAVLKALPPADRLRHLEHSDQRQWIDTIGLAAAEVNRPARVRLKTQRRKLYVRIGVATALSFVTAYSLGTRYPRLGIIESHGPPIRAAPDLTDAQTSGTSADTVSGENHKKLIQLPFSVRLISPNTLEDELVNDEKVQIADSNNPIPKPALRDGDFFLAATTETERTIIHVHASLDAYKIERTIVISGYVASHVPCDRRTIYLARRPFNISPQMMVSALRSLDNATRCADIDKALVTWGSNTGRVE